MLYNREPASIHLLSYNFLLQSTSKVIFPGVQVVLKDGKARPMEAQGRKYVLWEEEQDGRQVTFNQEHVPRQIHSDKWISGCQGMEDRSWGWGGKMTVKRYRASFWDDEYVLKSIVMMGTHFWEYTENHQIVHFQWVNYVNVISRKLLNKAFYQGYARQWESRDK